MNKYIKKCLIIYVSLATILCGMVGVTYAITATDADQYVTRSQYAVDMAHLQNKLDEAEAGLMGNINRYRSTDVKFVTWDTPNKYHMDNNADNGYYNGGNFGGRPFYRGSFNFYPFLGYTAGTYANKKNGQYSDFSIYRLYNGNYAITRNITYSPEDSAGTRYYQSANYAVPIESHPGWYLVIKPYYRNNKGYNVAFGIVKLDPNSTVTLTTNTTTLLIRFKKELFRYAAYSTDPLTTTKKTKSIATDYYDKTSTLDPLSYHIVNPRNRTSYSTITYESWIDSETGDYMMSMKTNLRWCYGDGSDYHTYTFDLGDKDTTICKVIPNDNVEYMMGPISYYNMYAINAASYSIPVAAWIGTGIGGDQYWQYEFVDCDNGIKYWHGYRAPAVTRIGSNTPYPVGVHYSLPIVY